MSVEGETCPDAIDPKAPSFSPSMQSDLSTDGDGSTNQNNSSSNDKFSQVSTNSQPASSEPKAKKRRKQSNPLKIQNATSPKFDVAPYELSEQNETESNSVDPFFVEDESLNQNHVSDKSKVSDLSSSIKGSYGSLAKVTAALYNNKIKEAAKANKVVNKSKESSLSSNQSVTDLSSPESSEENNTNNNEYKQSLQNPLSLMPPLLPMNPVDMNDASKLSVYPFSEFPPSIPQGNSLSITHRSFITSSGVRVFNPEAYCELCEKEFCNKYFLKTHKANKHGICSIDNNYSSNNYRQYKSMHASPQSTQQMINQMCETGAMFGSADSFCNICQKYFCNKYFLKKHRQNIHGIHESQEMSSNTPSSIHVPVISSPLPLVRPPLLESKSIDVSSGHPTKDEETKINVSLENIKNSINATIPLLNGSSPHTSSQNKTNFSNDSKEKKNEKFLCELCNIEFCDKCYLDTHKQNKHGVPKASATEIHENSDEAPDSNEKSNSPEDGDESNFKGQMCAPCMKTFSTVEAFQTHMLEVHVASIKDEDDVSRLLDTVNKKSLIGGIDKDLSQLDKSPSMQEVENSNSSNESGSFNCNFCLVKCKDKSSYVSHMETEHSFPFPAGSDSGQDATYSCDTCQEPFSDRLTLLSHKFKSHGIITPGFEEYLENGDVAYITGMRNKSGSSFCKICNKELCNKYFMKTHMMKMHGIGMDKAQPERWSSPSGSGGVYCDICQKLLCSKYFLRIHKQNVHGIVDESLKVPPTSGSPLYNNNNNNNNAGVNIKKIEKIYPGISKLNQGPVNDTIVGKEDPIKGKIFTCDLCGEEFSSKLYLQCHLVDKHVKINDSKSSNSLKPYSKLPEESKDAPKKVLPCSCCLYVNLGDNILAEIGHELKLISCIVCNITYQQSDYHAHHLSHGTALPLAKKLENGVHEPGTDYQNSGNIAFEQSKHKSQPGKFKRFRCSKCDKTFRTKIKCLHHIQVMHKSKKGLLNQCDQLTSPKKAILNNTICRKNSDVKTSGGTENGSGLLGGKETKDASSLLSSGFHEAAPLPVPYVLPKNSDVIMQPFHLSEPKPEGVTKQDIFVPSLVYLPVSQKVSEAVTVAFTLTPA